MVTQDTIFVELPGGLGQAQELTGLNRMVAFRPGPGYQVMLRVSKKTGYYTHCGQVAGSNKPYPHVQNEFPESICSCTGTLLIHGVKSWQRASGSSINRRTPWLLPVILAVTTRSKSICSSNGTSTRDYRAGRFLRNRNQIKFRDHRGSNQTVLLAWLKPANAAIAPAISMVNAKAGAGEVAAITIREILLRRLKGFKRKKFT